MNINQNDLRRIVTNLHTFEDSLAALTVGIDIPEIRVAIRALDKAAIATAKRAETLQ